MGKKCNKTLSANVNNDSATKSKRINHDGYFSLGHRCRTQTDECTCKSIPCFQVIFSLHNSLLKNKAKGRVTISVFLSIKGGQDLILPWIGGTDRNSWWNQWMNVVFRIHRKRE